MMAKASGDIDPGQSVYINPDGSVSQRPDLEGHFYSDVIRCARCGDDHRHMLFKKFINPPPEATYFAACPKWSEPILLKVVDHGE